MDIQSYISGEKSIPIETYFIDCSELSTSLNELYPEGKEIVKGLHFLGKAGIKKICGTLNVAYLSGI